jgi:hypothetical protein
MKANLRKIMEQNSQKKASLKCQHHKTSSQGGKAKTI